MKKITKKHLIELCDVARRHYVDDDKGDLDNKEFTAQCYLKACISFLNINEEFSFPKRKETTSLEESNG